MSCACVHTAILLENENDKLREKIEKLEKMVKKYRNELYMIYSDSSSCDENNYEIVYVSR